MGAPLVFPPSGASLTDKERTAVVRTALQDGTVQRIADLMEWDTPDLAHRINVLPSLLESWLSGELDPSPHACAKLWTVLVCAVRYEPAPRDITPMTLP